MRLKYCALGMRLKYSAPATHTTGMWGSYSLVPRPSLTAFFAAVAKSVATAAKKAVREGLGTRLGKLHVLALQTVYPIAIEHKSRHLLIDTWTHLLSFCLPIMTLV